MHRNQANRPTPRARTERLASWRSQVSPVVAVCLCVASFCTPGLDGAEVFCSALDEASAPGLVFPGGQSCAGPAAPGLNAACLDDLAGLNGGPGKGRLVLTGPANDQVGAAWVAAPVDPRSDQVSVALDLWIEGGSNPPADGLSVVFHEGAVPDHPGLGGGALGTGGLPRRYVSVGFDLWDSGDVDPESPCDGPSQRTCHAEVNWNSLPGVDPSLATSIDVPSWVDAGNAGVPVHAEIRLNGRELVLAIATDFQDYGRREVFRVLLPEDPFGPEAREVHVGVTASTGGANALHAVDHLCVATSPVIPPIIVRTPEPEKGGINCGGEEVEAMVKGLAYTLSADAPHGGLERVEPGEPTTFHFRGHGFVAAGDEHTATYTGTISGLEDPALEPVLLSERWSQRKIQYRNDLPPGRYEVTLLFAENCTCGLDREGEPARRMDVLLNGNLALASFSPAEAGARGLERCGGTLGVAVERAFEVDVLDAATGLSIEVLDLGGGAPPENAQLNGYVYRRLGDPTGAPLAGDLENHRPPLATEFGPSRTLIDLNFDSFPDGELAAVALEGEATVSFRGAGPVFLHFRPQIVNGRLQLSDDLHLANAASVVFDADGRNVLDPRASRVTATFEVLVQNAPGRPPADGIVFALVEGEDPAVLGAAGGALGFTGIGQAAIGVEIDLWEGGGFGDDSGYNTDGQGHLAVVGSGAGPGTVDHVQDQNDLDPSLDGAGWVDLLDDEGFRVEVVFSPEGRVEAFLTALDKSFPRRKVLDTRVTPFRSRKCLPGFFAATGGETASIFVDNLRVEVSTCEEAEETARIAGEGSLELLLPEDGPALLSLDGTASSTDSGGGTGPLSYLWSVEGPPEGAEVFSACTPETQVSFVTPGLYHVKLAVDDNSCSRGESADAEVLVRVVDSRLPNFLRSDSNCDGKADISDSINTLAVLFLGTGTVCCEDAADSNDDGSVDITDAIIGLNYLFGGGVPPHAPFPDCGTDPDTTDAFACESPGACP